MNYLKELYKHSLSLLTDLYQLTMAYGYWKAHKLDQEAVFTLFFRKSPFRGSYAIAAGLGTALDYLEDLHFTATDIDYLASLCGTNGSPLFEQDFLHYLATLRFNCDVDAISEGTLVFPHEPLLRVQGSLLQCQLLETTLLNIINFQTLIATKATRICQATQGQPVLEFGLRRAQGIDGGLCASRAAFIGGCAATSNLLAGKLFGIPVRGTHAHSWVMSFASEAEAFQAYAEAMPHNSVFLVDTYDTINGVKQAIQAGQWLRQQGYDLAGIRLDSGDLAKLSQQARVLLDEAGFKQARIVASNDLNEYLITELKAKGAAINVWGVGTQLITSYDQPALGGVYKLTAIRQTGGEWQHCLKVSEQAEKTSNPGILQVRRFSDAQGVLVGDMLFDELQPPTGTFHLVNLADATQRVSLPADTSYQDLLTPVMRQGQSVSQPICLQYIREWVQQQLVLCPETIKHLTHPTSYPVSLEQGLYTLKQQLIEQVHKKL